MPLSNQMRIVWIFSLFSIRAASLLTAQQIDPGFAAWEPPVTSESRAELGGANPSDTVGLARRDYRFEGLAFGGITFGTLGAWIGSRIGTICPTVPGADCDPDRLGNAAILGLTGAALGGTLGYLVGRFSPKRPRIAQPSSDSLLTSLTDDIGRKRIGYHHWEGMAIGAGSSALLMALLYLGAPTACSDCGEGRSYFLEAELISAGVGGALGFLIGLGVPKYDPAPATTLSE